MRAHKTLLPLVAFGGGLVSLPASALELGDVTVESRLGQPLRASIAYALAPNEQLSATCVTLGLGASASGLPGIGRATVSIADGAILLSGKTPVREPMVASMINVNCAYTANISREYLMFIDPEGPGLGSEMAAAASARPREPVGSQHANAPVRGNTTSRAPRVRAASPDVDQGPIALSSRYRVQPGDTLSQIAQRLENRSTSLWPAVNAIFDANPDAFIGDDPNRLKAGSWLTIPAFVADHAPVSAAASTASAPSAGIASVDIATESTVTAGAAVDSTEASAVSTQYDTSSDLSPASDETIAGSPFVDGLEAPSGSVVIVDTEIDGPVAISESPNVSTAVINNDAQAPAASSSWLLWLAGSGLALIVALLFFGRLFRGRPAGEAKVLAEAPQRRASDRDPSFVPDDGGIEVIAHTAYTIDDDSPTAENLTLDADLVMGTGLDAAGVDIEVSEDFGFAAPAELDLELPFEPQPTIEESDTGIFATDDDDTSVLDNVDLTGDDYDLSVVLDATKMPRHEEVTQRDFQAVEVEPVDDIARTDGYSINSDVDFEILEQDYEEELTATQALNKEIARAAAGLASDLQRAKQADADEITSEMTAATPLASVTELDVTAQLPSRGDGVDEETGIHEATVEVPAAENDATAEMEVDRGKIDTKAI